VWSSRYRNVQAKRKQRSMYAQLTLEAFARGPRGSGGAFGRLFVRLFVCWFLCVFPTFIRA